MAESRVETIKIVDESTSRRDIRFQLYIDGCRRGLLTKRDGRVRFHWEVYGPQQWPEAKVLLQGLLDLSVLADQLTAEEK